MVYREKTLNECQKIKKCARIMKEAVWDRQDSPGKREGRFGYKAVA